MKKPLSILIVHEVDYLEKVVFEFQEFAEVWAARGHKVSVVDFVELPKKFWQKGETLFDIKRAVKNSAGVSLNRTASIGGKFLSRIVSVFLFPSLFKNLFRDNQYDLVFLYSAPTNGLSLLRNAKSKKVPVIFRSIDILHHMREPWSRWFVRWAEERVYREVNRVSALTPALGRYAQKMGAKPENIVLNLPAVNSKAFFPKQDNGKNIEFRKKWGLGLETDLVIYLGTFFPFSGLDFLAAHIQEICDTCPNIEFVFVGGGALLADLKEASKNLKSRLTIIDFRPFSEVPEFLRESSLALNAFRLGPITHDIVPSKIFQYLSCGVPTLSTPLPGTQEILPKDKCGVVYRALEDFPGEITNLLGSGRHKLDDLRKQALQTVQQRFTQEVQVESFEKLFYEVVGL